MCGRYAQGFAVRVIAEQLERGELGIEDVRDLDNYYPSYNVAPTTFQPVYRRERSQNQDHTVAPVVEPEEHGSLISTAMDLTADEQAEVTTNVQRTRPTRHILQGMRWGLIPFWTKRAPDSSSQLKTINCRDDSLYESRGMWNSMKGRKRCIIPVQGYYEWLKKGPKEKIPHYTKRKDGQLLLLGGLYDSVQYEGSEERLWTYTIITTASSAPLSWLHDRMPLIFDQGSSDIERWLDDDAWSQDLLKLLHPYKGELDCYAVKKEVGKVGNNSPDFIIPIDSAENKSNIANFFKKQAHMSPVKSETAADTLIKDEMTDRSVLAQNNHHTETNAPMPTNLVKVETSPPHHHPIHSRSDPSELLHEEDLPFRFIPSHLETRPLETIDVYVGLIDASISGQLLGFIRSKLDRISQDLLHLKQVRQVKDPTKKIKLEDGVALSSNTTLVEVLLCPCSMLSKNELISMLTKAGFSFEPSIVQVSRWPPLSSKQHAEWKELWPLTWRVPAQRRVQMGKSEYLECEALMQSLFESGPTSDTSDLNIVAIAYDPTIKQTIARSQDSRITSRHPLKHAILELCASVAASEVVRRLDAPDTPAQYLLTNLWIFVTHEPCTMCTMALLHSRVARVFYARPMPMTGGMESTYGIHWRQELNHRFSVFGGWMESSASLLDDTTYV